MFQLIRSIGALLCFALFLLNLVGCATSSSYGRNCDPLNSSPSCKLSYYPDHQVYPGARDLPVEGATFDFVAVASVFISSPASLVRIAFFEKAAEMTTATAAIAQAAKAAAGAGAGTAEAVELVVLTRALATECVKAGEGVTGEYFYLLGSTY